MAAAGQVEIEADEKINYDISTDVTVAHKNVKVTQEKGIIVADEVTYNGKAGLIEAVGKVKLTTNGDNTVIIEADKLLYDLNTMVGNFSGQVELTSKEAVITADQLVYNGKTENVTASGNVKIKQKQAIYRSETIEYNLRDEKGVSGPISGVVRDYKLNGKNAQLDKDETKLNKATFTRCPKPHPDYTVTATRIKYDGKWINLRNAVLFIKGIPAFYFPVLSFPVDGSAFPTFDLGYSNDDGAILKFSYITPVTDGHNWIFTGDLREKDTNGSNIGAGYGLYKGNFSNTSYINYNFNKTNTDNYWSFSDTFSYDRPLFVLTVDGSHEFNGWEKTQYGFTFTRKYWDSPLGRWQLGVLARKVSALDGSGDEYGGVYGGYRLDYNPNRYMTFSLLRLESLTGDDYRDFLDDYRLGSNWLYSVGIPLNNTYSFNLDGTYNSDQTLWIKRVYGITRETCCFKVSASYDDIPRTWSYSISLKF
ncbi:MAG: LptA/OstA family protein [Bacillota bacterium]